MPAGRTIGGTITVREPVTHDLAVELVVTDAALSAPAAVVVPAGATTASFSLTANAVDRDVPVTITAKLSGREFPLAVRVLRIAANDFWIESRPALTIRHYTDSDSAITAQCSSFGLSVRIDVDTPFVTFALAPGVHEGFAFFRLSTPYEPSCSPPDRAYRLTVHERDITAQGVIRRFAATFELQCSNGAAARGQVHLTNPRLAPPLVRCGG